MPFYREVYAIFFLDLKVKRIWCLYHTISIFNLLPVPLAIAWRVVRVCPSPLIFLFLLSET